jgi:hypothetical protein
MAMIMFLVRTAFWLMILVLLLPTDEQQQSQVYGTAHAAVKDVSGFCERNPGVCEKSKDAFDVFVHKAQFGAQILMGFVKEQTGVGQDGAPSDTDASSPGSDATPQTEDASAKQASADTTLMSQTALPAWMPASTEPASVESLPSQNTLRPEDLLPAWGGSRAGA